MMTVFGDECTGNRQIKEWYKRFEDERTTVDSDPCSGYPWITKTNDNIKHVIIITLKHISFGPLFRHRPPC